KWEQQGEGSLHDQPRSGRPPTLTPEEQELAIAYIKEEPRSLKQVVDRLAQKTAKRLSISALKRLAKRARLRWKRVRKSLTRIIHQPEKSTMEGSIVTKVSRKTAVSQDHSGPKTRSSACRGIVQTGRMVAIGHTSPRSPYRANPNRFVLEPPGASIELTGPVRSDVRMPTGSNCASIPAPPGTMRAEIS